MQPVMKAKKNKLFRESYQRVKKGLLDVMDETSPSQALTIVNKAMRY